MNRTATHDFLADEEEAGYWLSVFEQLPDVLGINTKQKPNALVINKLNAFSRAYRPMMILGREEGVLIN